MGSHFISTVSGAGIAWFPNGASAYISHGIHLAFNWKVVPDFELVEGPEVVPTVEVKGDSGFWIWFWVSVEGNGAGWFMF
ncbi:Hypothetical predicted protein [Olea europaea subsp. europaea]|uniref:Uncharacterized protein n=1 Tax=Olea europaea subsp. europaea TaxID=158383 RepID=A0A8S0VHW5_OLEEU|nr:Hypothetical predicted protein [Olea europaea subsp. europaea]